MPDNLKMLLVIALAGAMFALLVYCGLQSSRIKRLRNQNLKLTIENGKISERIAILQGMESYRIENLRHLARQAKRDGKGRFVAKREMVRDSEA